MKILIIGGAGYVGTNLSNKLSNKHKVICVDTFWFGNHLNNSVSFVKADIRNFDYKILNNIDVVINLAYLANDPSCEIDARATWEIGPLSNYFLLEQCKKYKIKKFIFASSGSVYGIKKEKNVTEDLSLNPLTDYNKSKMICEKVIENYSNDFDTVIIRPGTVGGFSKRLRLDVVVNILSYQAYFNKKIEILGGNQIRPLIDMNDMINVYQFCVEKKITGTFNVHNENMKVSNIAESIKKIIPCKIIVKKSNDPRSYRMNSDKIKNLKFQFKHSIKDSVQSLINNFDKKFKPSDINWNYNFLKKKKII